MAFCPALDCYRFSPCLEHEANTLWSFTLSLELREAYARNGHVQILNVLSAHEIAEWRKKLAEALKARENAKLSSQDAMNKVFRYTRSGLRFASAGMHELVAKLVPVLGRWACELEGIPACRLYDEEAVIKEAGGVPTNPHVDVVNWSHDGEQGITAWFALDDVMVENGCLYFINGSHKVVHDRRFKEGSFAMPDTGDLGDLRQATAVFELYPESKSLTKTYAVIPAGSVSLHSGYTIHGAGPNMSQNDRRAFVLSFMPAHVRANGKRDILIDSQHLKYGDFLSDSSLWPLFCK